MLVDVPCVGITDPINEIVMDQIANCVGLVYVINCTKDNDFEVNKVSPAKLKFTVVCRKRGVSFRTVKNKYPIKVHLH